MITANYVNGIVQISNIADITIDANDKELNVGICYK